MQIATLIVFKWRQLTTKALKVLVGGRFQHLRQARYSFHH